jgi:formylglycine-generating enzyme required for sulfatase activity
MASFVTRPTARSRVAALVLFLAWLFPLPNPPIPSAIARAPVPKNAKTTNELEVEIATGVKMKFCWVPAGKATLGSPTAEKNGAFANPEYEYVTKGFWLGKYPVTQEEWKATMGDNPSEFDGKKDNKAEGMDTSRFPVECVSRNECEKFLEKLNKRTEVGKVFGEAGRFVLPDEHQWEYACRGGKGNKQAFYWGNELNGTQANCNGNEPYGTEKKGDYKERTTEVGSFSKDWPHPWGLCDMHGNVSQWCASKHEELCVIRGGAWRIGGSFCRSAVYHWYAPHIRDYSVGFRVCLSSE